MNYNIIKRNFLLGLWTESNVKMAYDKGLLTKEEYEEIIKSKTK